MNFKNDSINYTSEDDCEWNSKSGNLKDNLQLLTNKVILILCMMAMMIDEKNDRGEKDDG